MELFRQMTMKVRNKIKNYLLLSTLLLGQIPSLFYGNTERLNLSIFYERSTRIDFFFLYYTWAINLLIFAYMIYNPSGLSKRVKAFILWVSVFDLIHLMLFSQQIFGFSKIVICLFLYLIYDFVKRKQ